MLEMITDTPTDRVESLARRMLTAQTFDIEVFDGLLAGSYSAE